MGKTIGWILTWLGIAMVLAGGIVAGVYLTHQKKAGDNAQAAMEVLLQQIPTAPSSAPDATEPSIPQLPLPTDPEEDAMKPMPEIEIDGVAYIGYLEIPQLGLTLPVIGESNPQNLDIAPCRYYGSVYADAFVIGGHSYARHFGYLASLGYGEPIYFTDVAGTVYTYAVRDIERLQPYEGEYLCSTDWDLSLYTCTTGGGARITVRCERI